MNDQNWNKFKTLVHYICEKAEDPSLLGAVKLNKVLWYADAFNYMTTGAPITCATYVKRQHGPVPNAVVTAVDQLVTERKIARGHVNHFNYGKHEYISIEPVDKSAFNGNEISLVDEAFEYVCVKHTAKSISEETHGTIWKLAEIGECIPLETVFANQLGEIDENDIFWAQEKLALAA
ncbi:MAG TPA: Panacea domain-containing protein [Methylophilus sp.]|uniref:Panacea domain-containing protein n=1 Tax=Methylophilus sp. TaxID=29541 RepID=UPI002B82BAFB|nr:Panacea domain-containing protein [Methylophilus sp.]HSH86813.1 Panacea domain-containing protein [Methylophilus sp.]